MTQKLKALRNFLLNGKHIEAGQEFSASDADAKYLKDIGRAEGSKQQPAVEDPRPETAEAPAAETAEAPATKRRGRPKK